MEQYRQTLLGRALADVLGALASEIPDEIDEVGDELFGLLDEVLMDEFGTADARNAVMAARKRRKRIKGKAKAATATATATMTAVSVEEKPLEPLPPMYTHQSMDLTAKVESFNRFMGKWSLQVQLTPDSLTLDQNLVDLHLPTTESSMEMLVKMEEAHSAVGRP